MPLMPLVAKAAAIAQTHVGVGPSSFVEGDRHDRSLVLNCKLTKELGNCHPTDSPDTSYASVLGGTEFWRKTATNGRMP